MFKLIDFLIVIRAWYGYNVSSLEPCLNDPAAGSMALRLLVEAGFNKSNGGSAPKGATGKSEGRFLTELIFRDAWSRPFALAQGRAII